MNTGTVLSACLEPNALFLRAFIRDSFIERRTRE